MSEFLVLPDARVKLDDIIAIFADTNPLHTIIYSYKYTQKYKSTTIELAKEFRKLLFKQLDEYTEQLKKQKETQIKSVAQKSPSELIDSLITTNIKCFMAQEKLMQNQDIEKNAKLAQQLNARRNKLMIEIDKVLGYIEIAPTEKTYE